MTEKEKTMILCRMGLIGLFLTAMGGIFPSLASISLILDLALMGVGLVMVLTMLS